MTLEEQILLGGLLLIGLGVLVIGHALKKKDE